MTIQVSLTWTEVLQAAHIGVMRQVQNLRKGRQDAHGRAREGGWEIHILGCLGELATAKYTGQFWSGHIGDLKADDAGTLQVRTRSKHTYDLIVHPNDPDDRAFVLVTIETACEAHIQGWMWGRDTKRDEWWKDPARGRPAFFVPQSALKSPESLLHGAVSRDGLADLMEPPF